MRDRNGMTVEQVTYSLPARTVFVVRHATGHVVSTTGYEGAEPTTPEQVAALGVDLASLKDVA